jgi:hypothetical protein
MKTFKLFAVLVAISLLFCSCSSDKKTKIKETKVYEKYYSLLYGSGRYPALSDKKLDDFLKNYDTNQADYYAFKDDTFEIYYIIGGIKGNRKFSGTFEKDVDNKLNFNYNKVVVEIEEEEYNEFEEELKAAMPRTREVLIDGDYADDRPGNTYKEMLKEYNETKPFIGTAFNFLFSMVTSGDLSYDSAQFAFPQFEFVKPRRSDVIMKNADIILSGKFICTETYGVRLNGKYSRGNAFSFEYNPINTLLHSPFRPYYYDKIELICDFVGVDSSDVFDENITINGEDYPTATYYKNGEEVTSYDYSTNISFRKGKWTWKNHEDKVLLTGKYEESKDYPGLIKLSATNGEVYEEYGDVGLLVYISESGEILTPHYIALENYTSENNKIITRII